MLKNSVNISKQILALCKMKNTTLTALGEAAGKSKQNLAQQFKRDNQRINDIITYADILGYDLKITYIEKDSGNEINL